MIKPELLDSLLNMQSLDQLENALIEAATAYDKALQSDDQELIDRALERVNLAHHLLEKAVSNQPKAVLLSAKDVPGFAEMFNGPPPITGRNFDYD